MIPDPFANIFEGEGDTSPDPFQSAGTEPAAFTPVPTLAPTPAPAAPAAPAATATPEPKPQASAPASPAPVPAVPEATPGTPVTEIQVVSCDELDKMLDSQSRWFVYDLETVPDETRFPRPEIRQPQDRPKSNAVLADISGKPIASIKRALARLSVAELQELAQLESTGKNRGTLLIAINEEIEQLTGTDATELNEWRKLAFAPFGLRVVSAGIATRNRVYVVLCKTIDDERKLLQHLWECIAHYDQRIGYNIIGFDDQVIVARSMMLQMPATDHVMDRGRYAKESVDLMLTLFPTGTPGKLKPLCRDLGIVPPAGYEMSGDQVLDLVHENRWEDLALYSFSDATIERELFLRLRNYVVI